MAAMTAGTLATLLFGTAIAVAPTANSKLKGSKPNVLVLFGAIAAHICCLATLQPVLSSAHVPLPVLCNCKWRGLCSAASALRMTEAIAEVLFSKIVFKNNNPN
eukprot:SAG31_NODE_39_length_31377_cov_5.971482_21_plen_104_part_00